MHILSYASLLCLCACVVLCCAVLRCSELTRLLGTAKGEERKDVIRQAISALESSHTDAAGKP
jgi:hypothetical protein